MTFTSKKKLESNAFNFVILSCFAFNSAFVGNVATFLPKSAFFMNQAISDLSINLFCFIFASSV